MLVYRSVRGKEGTVAGAVELAVRDMPLDDTTHVRAGCGEGDDVGLIGSSATSFTQHIANDRLSREAQRLAAQARKRRHKVPGCRHTTL